MTGARILLHLARADFLERVRRYSFLVALAATVWLGYLAYAGYIQMHVGDHRGVYNSAWTGTLMAMSAGLFVSLAGFYIIKNAIQRDRETGVGQILAATRMPGWLYLLAKWLSNFAVLTTILAVLAAAAVGLQLLRAGEGRLEMWPLLSPFLLLSLPAMAMVAALGLLFETIPGLRGGGGNVAYFFFWSFAISLPMILGIRWADSVGIGMLERSIVAAEHAAFPGSAGEFAFNAGPLVDMAGVRTFTWGGLQWAPHEILLRLAWLPLAVGLAVAPTLWTDRFDPARSRSVGNPRAGQRASRLMHVLARAGHPPAGSRADRLLRPLVDAAAHFRFTTMVVAELRVTLKGVSWWWRLPALALFVAMLVVPIEAARRVLPYAWLWPILMWSHMGVRERRFGASQILFSSPHPLRRQLAALWMAGVALALLTGGSLALRLALAGDGPGLFGWTVGALFIPSLALLLGVWSGSSKLFEAIYIALWYAGPAQSTPGLDFMGVSAAAVAAGLAPCYFAAVPAILALAFVGRWRQLRT
jgi:hypothetical protein